MREWWENFFAKLRDDSKFGPDSIFGQAQAAGYTPGLAGGAPMPNLAVISEEERQQYMQMLALQGLVMTSILGGAALAPGAAVPATAARTAPLALPSGTTTSAQVAAQTHNATVVARAGTGAAALPGGGAASTAATPGTSIVLSAPTGTIVQPGTALVPSGQALSGSFGSQVLQAQARAAAHNARVGGAIPMGPVGSTSPSAGRAAAGAATGAPASGAATTGTAASGAAGTTAGSSTATRGALGRAFDRVRAALSRSGGGSGAGTAGATTTASPTAGAATTPGPGFFSGAFRPLRPSLPPGAGAPFRAGQAAGASAYGTYGFGVGAALPRELEAYGERRDDDPVTIWGLLGATGRAMGDPFEPGPGPIATFLGFGPGTEVDATPAGAPDAPGAPPSRRDEPWVEPSPGAVGGGAGGGAAGGAGGAGGGAGGAGGLGGGLSGGSPALPGVPRNLFQLQETDEERALIARALAEIERRRVEGTAALREGWGNVARINTAAAERARNMVVDRGDRGEAIWTGAEQRTREEAARRAAAAGQFEGRAAIDIDELGGAEDFVRFMQSQAPAERALAEAEQRAFAEDLEFLAQMSGQQGEAYSADMTRLAAAMEFERQAQHDQAVQDRINMERMALAQMQFQASQAAAAASRQERQDVSSILAELSGSFPAPGTSPEVATRQLTRIANELYARMGGNITPEQAIEYVMDWGESLAFRSLEQEFLDGM